MSYRVKLNVFEGPFDLLVYLIEHARMSIYDIKISEITNQYIEYVEKLRNEDINLSSEFMVLAAALLEIKSKMLLPRAVSDDGVSDIMEDPRTELVAKLAEYKKFKAVSEMLEGRFEQTAMQLEKPQEDLTEFTGEPDEYLIIDPDKFRTAFEAFLQRRKKLEEIRIHHRRSEKQRITNEIRMENIKCFFRENNEAEADFRELIEDRNDMYDVAVTFSSVLEMMKESKLTAQQKYLFGDIRISPTKHLFHEDNTGSESVEVKENTYGQ